MPEYAPDAIFVPDAKLKKLADSGVTPFYLYDEAGIRQSCRLLRQQFDWQPGFQNFFPIRENTNPTLLKIFLDQGLGVLACGRAELLLAKKCGFREEKLLYAPMARDLEATELALELEAGWLLQSPNLIPVQRVPRVLLRFYPTPARGIMSRPSRAERSKNGFTEPQLLEAIRLLRVRGVPSIGLAMDVAGSSFQPGFYAAQAAALFQLLPTIQGQTGVTVDACCLGDGFVPPYRPNVTVPSLEEEVWEIRRLYEQLPEALRPNMQTTVSKLLLERHGLLVTKVLEVRQLFRDILIVDASACQFLRPALKQAYRHISVLGMRQTVNRRRYLIAGYLPEEFDRFSDGRMLPICQQGDYCVIHDVGCGAQSMSMAYAMQPPCGAYLYGADGRFRQIAAAPSETQVLDFLMQW